VSRFPHMPSLPDENPLILNGKEKKVLAGLNLEASAILRKRTLYLREVARRKGMTSATLEGLKSKSGKPFVEEKTKRSWGRDYRQATIMGDSLAGLPPLAVETAYLCHSPYSKEDPDSCGWVKGRPVEQEYDDISFLSGSAGTRYYCKICGKQIGEHRMIVS